MKFIFVFSSSLLTRWKAALLLFFISVSSLPATAQTIPETYRGVWRNISDQGDCKHSDWNGSAHADTHIHVTAKEIELVEARCKFTSVKRSQYNDLRLMSSCMAEGTGFRTSEIWSVHNWRDSKLLVITNVAKKDLPTAVYQFCPKADASGAASAGRPDQNSEKKFETLPQDVHTYVSEVRGRCKSLLSEIPEQDRKDLNYIPDNPMQGIRHFELEGRPAIVADNFELCTSDIPGANCSNRGCDLAVWHEEQDGMWRRVFHEHVHERAALEFDSSSQRLQSINFSIYAGDGRCRPPPDREYTSGESCALVARFKNGQWDYQPAR